MTERTYYCPTCDGAGEVIKNDTNPHGYGPDPQCDEAFTCSECNEGFVTTDEELDAQPFTASRRRWRKPYGTTPYNAAKDPLVWMKNNRTAEGAWTRSTYDNARRWAMRPVRLPGGAA